MPTAIRTIRHTHPLTMSLSAAAKEALTAARLEAVRRRVAQAPRGTKLSGKVGIVTGTNSLRGIGYASARAFAKESAAHLYLLDPFDDNAAEVKKSLRQSYPDVKVTIVKGDSSDDKVVSSLCDRVLDEEGRLDIYYANGGISPWKMLSDLSLDDLMSVIKINTGSAFLGLKYGSKAMAVTSPKKSDSSGSVIFTASLAGLRGNAGPLDYSASKAAINNLAMTGAVHLAGQNIRVNSICPGLVDTAMVAQVFDAYEAEGTRNSIGWAAPLQRHALPQEIAQTALFLASDDSSFVNGQNIAVDGGLAAGVPGAEEPVSKMLK